MAARMPQRVAGSVGAQLGFLGHPVTNRDAELTRPLFVRVSFEVRAETVFGEDVVLVGDTQQLGAWNPKRGIRMTTSEDTYPIWRCEPLLLNDVPSGECEFKFVVVGPSGDVRWEPLQGNRRLVLGSEEVQVIADWGSLDSLPPRVARPPAVAKLSSVTELPESGGGGGGAGSYGGVRTPSSPKLTPIASCASPAPGGGTPSALAGGTPSALAGGSASAAADALAREAQGGPSARLLVVQHHLPFKLTRAKDGAWAGTWDDEALLATSVQGGRHLMGALDLEVTFIGMPKLPPGTGDLSEAEQAAVQQLLRGYSCIPVFLPSTLAEAHFAYSFTVLWPMLHNQIPDRHAGGEGGDGRTVGSWWKGYVAANEAYASAVKHSLRAGDMVWAHSHQLLLLPSCLRHARIPPSCTVSFFLHTPFPSPEVWRVLPHRTQLLHGMLASHVVGFHLFEYARHFMTSCRRLLGLGENVGAGPAGGVLSIDVGSRRVTITVSHVGIDCDVIRHRIAQPEVAQHREKLLDLRPGLRGRTFVGGVEALNKQQGVALKLLAYEQLLSNYPLWRPKLCLLQVVFPDVARQAESDLVAAECRDIVKRIKTAFGDATVEYIEAGVGMPWTVHDRLALLSLSHVYLNCATRDGLNLLPFEYVLTKSVLGQDGVVVLSEFVGCSHVLNGGVRVNPFNLEHVVEQLDAALSIPADERKARLQKDFRFVQEHTTSSWLKMAVNDMHRVRRAERGAEQASSAVEPTKALCAWPAGVRVGEALPHVSLDAVARAYRTACRRVFLFGLDGTLIQQQKVLAHLKNYHDFLSHSLSPPPAALHCLRALCADPQNTVYVISGRTSRDMETCLGDIAGLGLAAENGYLQRRPARGGAEPPTWMVDECERRRAGDDLSWRDVVQPILTWYTSRTNGAYIRWQNSAVQWCYYDADPDFGRFQARQLEVSLQQKLSGAGSGAGITVSHSPVKGMVEVRFAGVNKGVVADGVLRAAHAEAPVDFVLCIGDDEEDEYMLSAITARARAAEMHERLERRLFTITVGTKPASHAQFVADSSSEILSLLEMLREEHR